MNKKDIYKITNKINGHSYIGVSKNVEKRWKSHIKGYSTNEVSLIHRAIRKYGEENFNFEVIEKNREDWVEREQYWIKYYRTLVPYGYNIHKGGGEPPHPIGENNPSSTITQKTADNIIKQLQDWKIPRKTIVKGNKVTTDIVRHINDGNSWRKNELTYPLRPAEDEINELKAEYAKEMLINTTMTHLTIASNVGWGRTAITNINNGCTHFDPNLNYPLRGNNTNYKPVSTIYTK